MCGRVSGVLVVAGRPPHLQLDIMCIIGVTGRLMGKGLSRSGWAWRWCVGVVLGWRLASARTGHVGGSQVSGWL